MRSDRKAAWFRQANKAPGKRLPAGAVRQIFQSATVQSPTKTRPRPPVHNFCADRDLWVPPNVPKRTLCSAGGRTAVDIVHNPQHWHRRFPPADSCRALVVDLATYFRGEPRKCAPQLLTQFEREGKDGARTDTGAVAMCVGICLAQSPVG